jgi:hypothetical protein
MEPSRARSQVRRTGGGQLQCRFGHATHRLPLVGDQTDAPEEGAEQSESFPCARTESPKSGALNFTSIGQRCGGVAACCDFGILAAPDERAEPSRGEAI